MINKYTIGVLLPYKENYYNKNAGAVSLYVRELLEKSKFYKNTIIYGAEFSGSKLSKNFEIIKLNRSIISSKTNNYLNNFISLKSTKNLKILEIHNRPKYLFFLKKKISANFIFFFHNDPLTMEGSVTVTERLNILNSSAKVIFNSKYIEDCFFKNIDRYKYIDKFDIIYNSTNKLKKFPNKKKQIAFVGKLNHSKGYDIYCRAVNLILNEYPQYKAIAIGNERKKKIFLSHKNFKELGFLNYKETLKNLEQSEITAVPSRWEEPFGRTSLEAVRSGCYTIISNSGGLKETSDHVVILKKNNFLNLYNEIKKAILNNKLKKKIQHLSYKNIKHLTKNSVKKIDKIRNQLIANIHNDNKKILNIYNIGIRNNHRLYNISIGKKFTLGFIRNGYDVLEVSERDYLSNFEKYILKTIYNYNPKYIIFGHCKKINSELLKKIKINFPNIKIVEWNEDYLGPKGPDF